MVLGPSLQTEEEEGCWVGTLGVIVAFRKILDAKGLGQRLAHCWCLMDAGFYFPGFLPFFPWGLSQPPAQGSHLSGPGSCCPRPCGAVPVRSEPLSLLL